MKYPYIPMLIAAAVVSPVQAKDLKKEITVDRTIVPQERSATRLSSASPSILSPSLTSKRLNFTEYSAPSDISRGISFLEPATNADTLGASPYRGYAAIGYFPTFNLGASAGYRLIDTEETKLGAWLQYDGNSYKGEMPDGDKATFKNHSISLGADLTQRFWQNSTLDISLDYSHISTGQPYIAEDYTQGINRFAADVSWQSSYRGIIYHACIGYGHFGFSKDAIPTSVASAVDKSLEAVKENGISFNAGIGLTRDSKSTWAGINIDGEFNHYNHFSEILPDEISTGTHTMGQNGLAYMQGKTIGTVDLAPYFNFSKEKFKGHIGLRFDIVKGYDDTDYRISPDIKLSLIPVPQLSVYVDLSGQERLNTLGSLLDHTPYLASNLAYGTSAPMDLNAGINIGPFRGASIEIFGGYSFADDWLMPAVLDDGRHLFLSQDYDGWHAGARISYQYRETVRFHASFETAAHDRDKGYYVWRDRARWTAEAGVTVTPVGQLDIDIEFRHRADRRSYKYPYRLSDPFATYEAALADIGSVSDLSAGALYRLTGAFSVFARCENILNHRYDMLYGIPSQGIKGLAGITLKF